MNRNEKIALWLGVANLAVVLLFPPFDSFSLTDTKALFFAGFKFVFSLGSNEVINSDVLFLELVVLLVNVGVAWLLSREARRAFGAKRNFIYRNAILLAIASNLAVILLFPPFEYFNAITHAPLPIFQGFYFVFSAGPMLTTVTLILYLEVVFVLLNGAVMWLIFRKDKTGKLPLQKAMQSMRKLSGK